MIWLCLVLGLVLLGTGACRSSATFAGTRAPGRPERSQWEVGTPIVSYYQGPGSGEEASMWNGPARPKPWTRKSGEPRPRFEMISPAVAKKLAAGGFNLMYVRNLADLDSAHAQGMRGLLYVHEGKAPWRNVFHTDALDDPAWLAKLDALIESVKDHPGMYAYYITDEPSATEFPALGRLVAYLRERDPKHTALINLFPTYASAAQLGTSGDTVTAYREHLRQFVEIVKPDLISYDHYHFQATADGGGYFLNLALVREAALAGGVPFVNVVQAYAEPGWRVPNGDEGRFLAYTTLAYGGQGIFQFVYNAWEGSQHWGGVENPDGTLTPLGKALRPINPEFVAVARELQPLTSLGAYHLGTVPLGGVGLPADASFAVDPPVPAAKFNPPAPVTGILLGYFGVKGNPTHVLVVNLDYAQEITTTVVGPGPLEVFDTEGREWRPASDGSRAKVNVMAGGGQLLRLAGGAVSPRE